MSNKLQMSFARDNCCDGASDDVPAARARRKKKQIDNFSHLEEKNME